MNRKRFIFVTGLALMLAAGNVLAQEVDDVFEGTIRLMGQAEAELPSVVTREIVLPDNVVEDSEAVAASTDRLAAASEARRRREDGLTVADEARENASDFAEAAQDNAENQSRGDEYMPDTPDLPDIPTPPTGG